MNINKNKSYVSTYENQADVLSQIFVSKVPDKLIHTLRNDTLLVLDLQDSNGDQLPADTEVFIGGKKTTPVWPTDIDDKSYRPYHQINKNQTVAAQYDDNNQAMLKLEVSRGRLDFIEGHEIHIWVRSSAVVDWDNSTVEFEVEERPYRD